MANQSAKKNQKNVRPIINILTYCIYAVLGWFIISNGYYLLTQEVGIIHFILTLIVGYVSYFCFNTIVKYLELQSIEAAEYHIDILALNAIVMIFDPITHFVWHVYWLILVFILWHVGKWLWGYITPKYEQTQQGEQKDGKKEKKQKRQKIKYLKK